MTEAEAATVDYLAKLTGRTAAAIVERVSRSRDDWQIFRAFVSLHMEVWDYFDGETGQWTELPGKQDRQFRSYAATLFHGAT